MLSSIPNIDIKSALSHQGAMSRVYLGFHRNLKIDVVVKFLDPDMAHHDHFQFVRRFEEEGSRLVELFDHPNIVTPLDRGQQDDRYFIIMEYVRGLDLERAIQASGPLPFEFALDILYELSEGLRAAHEIGIVHRDIKPANILLGDRGQVKISDFGIAYALAHEDRDGTNLTVDGQRIGTPAYMSPEQVKALRIDHRTDIFSLGVVGFQILAGERPFLGESASDVYEQIESSSPPPVHSRLPRLPEDVASLIDRMLKKEREQRFQDMDATKSAIESCMHSADPTGSLFRERRALIRDYVRQPREFVAGFRRACIERHLLRAQRLQRNRHVDDARREFEYVLAHDPAHDGAQRQHRRLARPRRTLHRGLRAGGLVILLLLVVPLLQMARFQASLVVQSNPGGARLAVRGPGASDFSVIGITPCTVVLDRRGEWGLRIQHAEQGTASRTLQVDEEREYAVSVTFATGRFYLTTTPSGASVEIRRSQKARFQTLPTVTPLLSPPLSAGDWEARVHRSGSLPVMETITVRDSDITHVRVMLEPEHGTLSLESEPTQCTVEARSATGGSWRRIGVTPLFHHELAAGHWEVRVSHDGYRSEVRKVDIVHDRAESLSIGLERDGGRIHVSTTPTGSTISVRRQQSKEWEYLGAAPLTYRLAAGSYEVRAQTAGHQPRTSTVELRDGAMETLSLELMSREAAPAGEGEIAVRCVPSLAAAIMLDGELAGYTPQRVRTASGSHRLAVVLEGYRVVEIGVGNEGPDNPAHGDSGVEIEVPSDGLIEVDFVLTPTSDSKR
jgi:tRNA A-37 threonylcarbamoyl transferase component Bud32